MPNVPGFYGKFPELGDFVNRRLPLEFIEEWDDWLQQAISHSKESLAERWLDAYLTSPIWRFVVHHGLLGEYPWCGVLMPSVDRVGRYFPLTVACRLPLDANPVSIIYDGNSWFDASEKIILTALEEQFDLDDFDNRVVSLGDLDSIARAVCFQPEKGFGQAWQIPLFSVDCRAELSGLVHNLFHQRFGNYSAWWSSGSENANPSLLLCPELPKPADFASMMLGNWNDGSWEQWSPVMGSESVQDLEV